MTCGASASTSPRSAWPSSPRPTRSSVATSSGSPASTDLHSFMGHMLLEATRQFDAVSGAVIVLKDSLQEWRIVAHVREGQLGQPPYATSVPVGGSVFTSRYGDLREPRWVDVDNQTTESWPGLTRLSPTPGRGRDCGLPPGFRRAAASAFSP